MKLTTAAVGVWLCAQVESFVVPRTSGSTTTTTSLLRVISDPTREDLVTREANIHSSGRRTTPTKDPYNPEFGTIQSIPYNQAFPGSTKEYKTEKQRKFAEFSVHTVLPQHCSLGR